jgi:iron complex transport system substrate-binding protein
MCKRSSFLFILIGCLSLFAGPAQALRIVSLLPSNTEILEALGAADDVVGVTRFDSLLTRKPGMGDIGDFMHPNMEKIVSLKPDLVVAGYWTSSHIVPHLRKIGYTVVQIRNPRSLVEIYQSFRDLAQAAGRLSAADPLIKDMQSRLKKVQERGEKLPRRLKVYIEIDNPYWTISGHDYLSEAMKLAGADNIFFDLKNQAAQVTPEVIVERNPDLILTFSDKRAEVAAREGWAKVKAVKTGYIIDDLPQDPLSRPSPPLAAAMEEFVSRLEKLENP